MRLDTANRSFAYGAFTPRVAVSRGLYEAASQQELDAVLAHERYHIRNLDPLKVLLARALPAAGTRRTRHSRSEVTRSPCQPSRSDFSDSRAINSPKETMSTWMPS